MPRFSIVIAAYRVQGYLRACLDSVLTQSFRDVEVVAVDDCSPDFCGAIIDEYAARDGRVIAVHQPVNSGPGRARNAGAEQATGDYLLFLDGDDTLAPGTLQGLADRLAVNDDPDILYFDHVRTYWNGRRERSLYGDLLASAGTDVFSVLDRPQFLRLFAMSSNRVYRRDFYTGHGFAFSEGIYEDALLSYRTMLTARRIAATDLVGLEYRQRRSGASTRSPGAAHFVIFDQYTRLFTFLDGRPELTPLRPLLFERAVSHFLFCLDNPARVATPDRPRWFRRAAQWYDAHLPPGFTPPPEKAERFEALRRGSFARYRAHELPRHWVRGARRLRRTVRRPVATRAKRALYRVHLGQPVDENLAVYSAYWNRGVLCNPAAIYHKARELAPQVRGVWVVRKSEVAALPEGVEYVIPGTRAYYRTVARARYLINNVNFANDVVKRPGTVHLQTLHGTPLKCMGLDQQRYPAAGAGMSFTNLLKRVDRWDYALSSNQHSSEVWERVYPSSYQLLETGYPRNDVFFTATPGDIARIRAELGIDPDRTAILYTPTLRDYERGFTPRLDLERVARALGERMVLLVRAHYSYGQDPGLQRLQEEGLVIDVSRHRSVEELCLAADALVTDYSSIMFDYANLDRPIVIHADDWEIYRATRGVYFDLLSGRPGDTPGPVARTEDELIAIFREGRWQDAESTRLRAAFRERFCQFDDGHAAERVVRLLMPCQDAAPAAAPETPGAVVPPVPDAPPGAPETAPAGGVITLTSAPAPAEPGGKAEGEAGAPVSPAGTPPPDGPVAKGSAKGIAEEIPGDAAKPSGPPAEAPPAGPAPVDGSPPDVAAPDVSPAEGPAAEGATGEPDAAPASPASPVTAPEVSPPAADVAPGPAADASGEQPRDIPPAPPVDAGRS
ncbi:CDP-glycerol glycerophosphotransferase family protein [Streptomyces pactum]|uniref:CDP-glycerol glycerophosphotransferase family protein n=1 Tax=Streptomyces pactum TaxID=68249 RepID=A0ABS0NNB5_9ACTN|nr:bifunctional glycosyltransferase/CDP-glycerol:glycerophosphate glycerophosphotransferase [Streptomyces pactum]MBH5336686.1 CDP-glycerol glycerophosphotransferase family protein [Streptomyces pactum]